MKTLIITFVVNQALLLTCLFGQDWKFESGEEDWGETVYASQSNSEGAIITIFSAKGEFKPAILISPYKSSYGNSLTVEITVDKGQAYRFDASISDYFGEIEVDGIGKELLEEMKRGNIVSLSLGNEDTLRFSLKGSFKAIGQLDRSMENIENTPLKDAPNISKPTRLQLTSDNSDHGTVTLRWEGDTPSMDMNDTNSGEGWAEGRKESPGVYEFFQTKFYRLTLDFNNSTFVEGGFDGTWLPEVKGTFSPIK